MVEDKVRELTSSQA